MHPDLKPMISEQEIQAKVKKLAAIIDDAYQGKNLVAIAVLNGAFVFFADLIRQIKIPFSIGFVRASSYSGTNTTGVVTTEGDLGKLVSNQDILFVEDIVDTGLTIGHLLQEAGKHGPRSVKICTLFDKKARRQVDVPLDFIGFEVPDKFIVGYGMDFNNQFRNLPFITVCEDILPLK